MGFFFCFFGGGGVIIIIYPYCIIVQFLIFIGLYQGHLLTSPDGWSL